MKDLNAFKKIFIAKDPCDFRKQRHGLAALVKGAMGKNPLDHGSLFVFFNRRQDSVKLLYFDETGFALWTKVLEKNTFSTRFLATHTEDVSITSKELKWLLQGVDISMIQPHRKVGFTSVF